MKLNILKLFSTPSGRRRRGMSVDKEGRGLFYNDQEEDDEEGNIFLPSPKKYVF